MSLTNNCMFSTLQALLNDYEFMFLKTLSDPIRAVKTMLIVKLLSSHAQDEVYLVSKNEWISVRVWQYSSESRFNIFIKKYTRELHTHGVYEPQAAYTDGHELRASLQAQRACLLGKPGPRSCMACIPVCWGNVYGKLVIHHVADVSTLAVPQIAKSITSPVQDPRAKNLQAGFIQALSRAETIMHQRNEAGGPASRARHSPVGVPYKLLYPSGGDVEASNQGMTGRGIP
jgi:hypothetical protein